MLLVCRWSRSHVAVQTSHVYNYTSETFLHGIAYRLWIRIQF